jgi:2-isopropylmalate synthase/UPF0716 protein FxsA
VPLVLLILYLFFEVMTTAAFINAFGGLALFLEIITTAVVGVLMFSGLNRHMGSLMGDLMARRISEQELVASSLYRVIGALLLIVPGILTDLLGLMMQFRFLGRGVMRRFYRTQSPQTHPKGESREEIIDVEVVDSADATHHSGSSRDQ